MRGPKPKPSALRRSRPADEPIPPNALPRCPDHLSPAAKREWRRLATPLFRIGVLTVADRAALAAYCQAYGRWVEAEEKLKETPPLLKTPSGYVQQSPWLSIAHKQLELMGRYMSELGLTPASRTRLSVPGPADKTFEPMTITIVDCFGNEEKLEPRAHLPAPLPSDRPD